MSGIQLPGYIQERVPLAPFTTIGLGGAARYFAECASVENLREALAWAGELGMKVHILGGGSNTVFRDEGFDGLVIRVLLKGIEFQADGTVIAAAGEDWDSFVRQCVERGLAGVECLSGIPGFVGGTPIQNVGAYGQEVGQVIREVRTLDVSTLEERAFAGADCGFGYRWSRFKGADAGKYVVTSVVYALTPGGKPSLAYEQVRKAIEEKAGASPSLREVRDIVIELRAGKSMVVRTGDPDSRSCGSFFENIQLTQEEFSALQERARAAGIQDPIPSFPKEDGVRVATAWLIGHTPFGRGFSRGGVGISTKHNLALVATDEGSAKALLALADDIIKAVHEKFGVELRREPVVA